MKNLLIFLVFFFSTPLSFAQTSLTINGRISDAVTQEVLVGANVYPLSDWQRGTSTDEQGSFSLTVTEDDTLMIAFIGYRKQVIPVATVEVSLVLRLVPTTQNMETVTVEASSLVAEEFSIKKIEQLEIYTNPNAKADPLLAVNALPAATTLDESANVSLRGSSPAQTGIFLNEVPIYDAVRFGQLNGIGTFSIFNTALIQELQVFASNPPLEYGNTSAGLISLRTVEQIPEQAKGSLALSPANLGVFAMLPTGPASALTLFGNFQPSGVIQALNPESLRDLKHFQTLDFGAHYVHQLGERSQLKVFNYAVREGYRFVSRHPSANGLFRQRKQRNFTVVNYQTQYEHAQFTLNGGFSASRTGFSVGNLDLQLANRDLYLSANYTRFWDRWTLRTGLTYDARRAKYDGQLPVYSYAQAAHHPTYSLRSTLTARVPEGYVYAKYQAGERWTLGGGLRKNLPLSQQESYLSYQFNTHYRIAKYQTLTASVGRYHQYIIPSDDNPVNFYQSDQFALDYQYRRKGTTLSAALFYKDTQRGNRETPVYGAEVAADIRWSPKLRTQVSYTYLNATVREETTEYASPYDLNYFIRGSASYRFTPSWTLGAIVLHRQGTYYDPVVGSHWVNDLQTYAPQYASPDQALRLPDYSTVGLNLAHVWPLSENWSAVMFGNVNNLLNRQNVRTVNYNQDYSASFHELFSQRVFYLGVVLQWR